MQCNKRAALLLTFGMSSSDLQELAQVPATLQCGHTKRIHTMASLYTRIISNYLHDIHTVYTLPYPSHFPARPVGKSIGSVHRQVLWRHVTFQVVRGMLMNRSYVYSTTSMTYQLLPGSTDFPACNAQDGVDVTRSRISMTALQRTHSNPLYNPIP